MELYNESNEINPGEILGISTEKLIEVKKSYEKYIDEVPLFGKILSLIADGEVKFAIFNNLYKLAHTGLTKEIKAKWIDGRRQDYLRDVISFGSNELGWEYRYYSSREALEKAIEKRVRRETYDYWEHRPRQGMVTEMPVGYKQFFEDISDELEVIERDKKVYGVEPKFLVDEADLLTVGSSPEQVDEASLEELLYKAEVFQWVDYLSKQKTAVQRKAAQILAPTPNL